MRVLEVKFPGPSARPTGFFADRPPASFVTTWDRLDLQEAGLTPPFADVFSQCPMAWQSVTVQTALIFNLYMKEDARIASWITRWVTYDVIIVRWSHFEHIPWSLLAFWALRQRFTTPKIVAWGRYTSYGRDASADLRALQPLNTVSRFLDAVVCAADPAALASALLQIHGRSSGPLFKTLLSTARGFQWCDTSSELPRQCGVIPSGQDLTAPDGVWCGIGNPKDLTAGSAWLQWQASSPRDLVEGSSRIREWLAQGKKITLTTPIEYPWLKKKDRLSLASLYARCQWIPSSYHEYKMLPPLVDLPDSVPGI